MRKEFVFDLTLLGVIALIGYLLFKYVGNFLGSQTTDPTTGLSTTVLQAASNTAGNLVSGNLTESQQSGEVNAEAQGLIASGVPTDAAYQQAEADQSNVNTSVNSPGNTYGNALWQELSNPGAFFSAL